MDKKSLIDEQETCDDLCMQCPMNTLKGCIHVIISEKEGVLTNTVEERFATEIRKEESPKYFESTHSNEKLIAIIAKKLFGYIIEKDLTKEEK